MSKLLKHGIKSGFAGWANRAPSENLQICCKMANKRSRADVAAQTPGSPQAKTVEIREGGSDKRLRHSMEGDASTPKVLTASLCLKMRLTYSNHDKESGIEIGRPLVITPFALTQQHDKDEDLPPVQRTVRVTFDLDGSQTAMDIPVGDSSRLALMDW